MEGNYRILKILNNNAIVSRDADGQEVIIVGTGIGLHTRIGNEISPEKVSKQYILQGRENYRRFETLLKEIPFDCIEISEKIIEKAKQELKRDLNSNLIIALADHINFAVSQLRAGNRNPNLMLDEIQRFYREEFQVGLEAVEMVNQHYNITLPRSEAASIAFHLINAESGGDAGETTSVIKGTEKILQIIQTTLNLKMREDTLSYSRLVTHTKYFVKRVLAKPDNTESDIMGVIRIDEEDEQYIQISDCLDKIGIYLKETFDYDISEDERFYMLIHIMRIMQTE